MAPSSNVAGLEGFTRDNVHQRPHRHPEHVHAGDFVLKLAEEGVNRAWRRLTARLPLGAAIEQILDESGWLALAATAPARPAGGGVSCVTVSSP